MNDKKLYVAGEEAAGCLPMSKLSDEAVALLTACNSLLNSFALQQLDIPVRLLTDLTLFCRENTGFMIPFPKLATMAVQLEGNSQFEQLQNAGVQIHNVAKRVEAESHNLAIKLDVAEIADASVLLDHLADLELLTERVCQMFGWDKMMVKAAARAKIDRASRPTH